MHLATPLVFLTVFALAAATVAADWQPAEGPLRTRWTEQVKPDNAHSEHPRPQLVRDTWQNLNGLWDYAVRPKDEVRPEQWDGKILVPFAIESALSGVMKKVGPDNKLWYHRTFQAPDLAGGQRLLLHFQAVDWHAVVWVNGTQAGEHKGGYTPFTLDITEALEEQGEQEIVVAVWDPTDANYQPRGKQVREPRGIWYTSVTGIWQTAWLEVVPAAHIQELKIVPDVDGERVLVMADVAAAGDAGKSTRVRVTASFEGRAVASATGKPGEAVAVPIPNARLWSPDQPNLYDLRITLEKPGADEPVVVDRVRSYCGLRKIEVKKDSDGFDRMFLNGKPQFMIGPLDQGWWPDGLYTAPTDEALRYDIEVTKKLGMNMARKHVKVEPLRWYYWCDKLGLLVWQDMPSGDKHIRQTDLERTPESEANFWREYEEVVDTYHNHPSIIVWVPFNEGWGQFKTNEVMAWTKKKDPTRLVGGPSGWTDRGVGDLHDKHSYPGPDMFEPTDGRVSVLGEFGGLGLPLEGHLWWDKRNWGYRNYKSKEELQSNYERVVSKLRPLIAKGLAAAVYTQTTDVEGEVNGLMTYDREVIKLDVGRVAALHAKLYEPPPIITYQSVAPTSEKTAQTWRYTVEKPAEDWFQPGFDDSRWQTGPGGFGRKGTPGSVIRTEWHGADIWLRRTFEINDTDFTGLHLRGHHDEEATVYINGRKVASLDGFVTEYSDVPLGDEAKAALKKGTNTLAVHCHQTDGGQYIDVGLVLVTETPRQ